MKKKQLTLLEQSKLAKEALYNHGVIAFPTETVMGLGILYNDEEAYRKLNTIKRRPEDKPYTLMLKCKNDIKKYGIINEATQRVIDAFMPGSITILVPVKDNSVPSYVHHSTGVIGVRIPCNKVAIYVLKNAELPLLVPSANRSGEKPALNSDEVKSIFGNELDFVVLGEAKSGSPSTIVDLTKTEPKVIREGAIKEEEILRVYYNEKKC